jgi:hypothetical protein
MLHFLNIYPPMATPTNICQMCLKLLSIYIAKTILKFVLFTGLYHEYLICSMLGYLKVISSLYNYTKNLLMLMGTKQVNRLAQSSLPSVNVRQGGPKYPHFLFWISLQAYPIPFGYIKRYVLFVNPSCFRRVSSLEIQRNFKLVRAECVRCPWLLA